MNVLDENIEDGQCRRLRSRRIRVRQIGVDVGRSGMSDVEIITLLHGLAGATFFTHDRGFFRRELSHRSYCLVHLNVGQYNVAEFVPRFLRQPGFRTRAQRMGCVVQVSDEQLRFWKWHDPIEHRANWVTKK